MKKPQKKRSTKSEINVAALIIGGLIDLAVGMLIAIFTKWIG